MKFSLHLTEEDIREILHRHISRNYSVLLTREDIKILPIGRETDFEVEVNLQKATLA